jgi:hypothetical protein
MMSFFLLSLSLPNALPLEFWWIPVKFFP